MFLSQPMCISEMCPNDAKDSKDRLAIYTRIFKSIMKLKVAGYIDFKSNSFPAEWT